MIPTSGGSPLEVRAKPVSEFVAEFIQKLQNERQPGPGERALTGATGQSIKDNEQYYA